MTGTKTAVGVCLLGAICSCIVTAEGSASWERQTWQTENGLPQNSVHAVVQSADGYIWVGTEGGVARFDGFRFQVFNTESNGAMPSNDVRALAAEKGSGVWAATAGGLVRISGEKVQSFGTSDGLPSLNVNDVFRDAQDRLIAVTASGMAMWNGKDFSRTQPFTKPDANRQPTPQFGADDPLTKAGILCRFEDREGNVWIGTDSQGLTVLRRTKFTVTGQRQGLSADAIRCGYQTRDGAVWIGTTDGGLNRWKEGKLSQLGVAQGLSSDVIIALGEDQDGDLAVGTPDGLDIVRKDKVAVLTSADGLADDLVRSISGDGETLYAGTRRGLTAMKNEQFHTDKFRTYTTADGLGSDLVGATLAEGRERLWIATLGGLSVLEHGRIKNYTVRDGLTSSVITALYRDGSDVLWIGTQGGSLNCYRGGHFEHFPSSAGLPKVIYGITEDGGGNLWMASNTGIYRVDRQRLLDGKGEAVAYGTSDGLRINECSGGGHPALWKASDGTLWFATPKGVASMTPEQARLNQAPPPVVIEALRIDDRESGTEGRLTIGPGHTRFAFEYAGLSFVAPQKVRYRYQLEGFDKNWIEAGTRRVAYYTNLGAGTYTFHVTARNNDGIWNLQGAQTQFRLEPHFYQTIWFYCLCAMAGSFLIYGAYRWRVRQVALRYDAVLAERNRIAREIHDTLAQGFAGVSVQLELISRLMGRSAEAAAEHINEARKLVKRSLNEARRSIWELRSQSATVEDLPSRLSHLTHQSLGSGDCRIAFNVTGTLRPLPQSVEDELTRIAEEAVRNAQQHGQAKTIDLKLSFDQRAVRLSVGDDGKGFEVGSELGPGEGHFGLAGMRERAEAIGGMFRVESSAGKGTVVTVEALV